MCTQEFKAGEYIARQGESGDKFYVVASGEVSCCLRADGGEEEQVSLIILSTATHFND
jgi:CRP-like cAMP-binding protein